MNNPSIVALVLLLAIFSTLSSAIPSGLRHRINQRTADPTFPDSPPSCQLCAQAWPSIDSCCAAAPLFANFTQIIFNPLPFVDVIECSCTDTFKSAFPQCVDCFQQTNQTDVLNSDNLPAVVSGMRTICGMVSTLLGGVASTNRQLPSETPITVTPNAAQQVRVTMGGPGLALAALFGTLGFVLGGVLLL